MKIKKVFDWRMDAVSEIKYPFRLSAEVQGPIDNSDKVVGFPNIDGSILEGTVYIAVSPLPVSRIDSSGPAGKGCFHCIDSRSYRLREGIESNIS